MVTTQARPLTPYQVQRYSRHIIMPQVGSVGQRKLIDAKVLIVGAGGLGSPIAIYLTLAGVGTVGIVDFDTVDVTNLQRQVLHYDSDIGKPKVESAVETLKAYNPETAVIAHEAPLNSDNAMEIIQDYDIVINGADNFPARYLVNDAAYLAGKPLVDGSILLFDGMATVFLPGKGLLPLPVPHAAAAGRSPQLRRSGRAGDAPRHGRHDTGDRNCQTHSRHRRIPLRAAAAHRRARHGLPPRQAPAQPGLPAVRGIPHRNRAHRLRSLLRRRAADGLTDNFQREERGVSDEGGSLSASALAERGLSRPSRQNETKRTA